MTLQYIDWLALQLLPDTAETVWLDRHGAIWLKNADGTVGRKQATFADGTIAVTGIQGSIVPSGALLMGPTGVDYQTTQQILVGSGPTEVPVLALDAGAQGNMLPAATISFSAPPPNVNGVAVVISMDGGVDPESDDELRGRVLQRIQEPPMGGDNDDYEQWAESVPGVTRAWTYPLEMGPGTVTTRFMMDDLRAEQNGFPFPSDVATVQAYIDSVRPVTVKDFWAEAPIPFEIEMTIQGLVTDAESVRAGIIAAVQQMLFLRATPGQTIYRAWVEGAIVNAPGVDHYNLLFDDTPMPSSGYLAVLGTIIFA